MTDMEVDGPGEFSLFLQLAPNLILIPIAEDLEPKVEGPSEEEMLARSAGRKAEKVKASADEEEEARIEAEMATLQARQEALKAKLKPKKAVKKELPDNDVLLAEPPTGFQSGRRLDGKFEFILDEDNELVASGSGTHLDPELKKN
jgi:hypothetical protein